MTIKLKTQPAINYLLSRELINSSACIERVYDWITDYFLVEFGLLSNVSSTEITLDKAYYPLRSI